MSEVEDLHLFPKTWRHCRLSDFVKHKSGDSKIIKGKQSSTPGRDLCQGFSASGPDVWVEVAQYSGPGVVISAVGARCGKTFIADGEWTAIANTHVLRPSTEVDNKFLWYLTNREEWWLKSGTAQPFVKVKDSLERPFVLPPREEQERIVEILEEQLSRLDAAVKSVQTVREKAAQFRRSLYSKAFEGASGKAAEVKTIQSKMFGEFAKVESSLTDPLKYQAMPHIAPNHIESSTGRLLEYSTVEADGVISSKHHFKAGQILYSKIRPYLNKVALVDFEGLCSADMYPISTSENSKWLYYAMLSPQFVQRVTVTQSRTVLPKVNVRELSQVVMNVPSRNIQDELVEFIDFHLATIDLVETNLLTIERKTNALRRSLLHAAFTGELTRSWREAHV